MFILKIISFITVGLTLISSFSIEDNRRIFDLIRVGYTLTLAYIFLS